LALEILQDWDGVLNANSAAAAVYEYFVISMLIRLARSKAPKSTEYALDKGFHPMALRSFFTVHSVSNLIRKMNTEPEGWFEEGWSAEKEKALTEAVEKLRHQFGEDTSSWSWGSVHNLVLTHPMGIRPPLDKIFNRGPYPMGGDHDTVSQAGRLPDEFGSNVTSLANLRAIHDIGNWDESRFVLAGGQSGNPLSPHYDDLLKIWLKGETVSITWAQDAVEKATRRKLRLIPNE
jgi:penicillin amidase